MGTAPDPVIEAATLPGGEVNQDRYLIGTNFVGVFDGASSFTADSSAKDGGWYADALASAIKLQLETAQPAELSTIVSRAVASVARAYQLTVDTSPTSTVTLARWTDEAVEILVLGDSSILLVKGNESQVVCDDRIDPIGNHLRIRYRERLASGSGFDDEHNALLSEMQAIQRNCRNTEGGYWICGADPEAPLHAYTVSVPRDERLVLILATDGVDLPNLPQVTIQRLIDLDGQLPAILSVIERLEATDSEGARYPRSKVHDDKTVVRALLGSTDSLP